MKLLSSRAARSSSAASAKSSGATTCACAAGYLWDAGLASCERCPVSSHECANSGPLTVPSDLTVTCKSGAAVVGIDYVLYGALNATLTSGTCPAKPLAYAAPSGPGDATTTVCQADAAQLFAMSELLAVTLGRTITCPDDTGCSFGGVELTDPCPGYYKSIAVGVQCATCKCPAGQTLCFGECKAGTCSSSCNGGGGNGGGNNGGGGNGYHNGGGGSGHNGGGGNGHNSGGSGHHSSGCYSNKDCKWDEACDRYSGVCRLVRLDPLGSFLGSAAYGPLGAAPSGHRRLDAAPGYGGAAADNGAAYGYSALKVWCPAYTSSPQPYY